MRLTPLFAFVVGSVLAAAVLAQEPPPQPPPAKAAGEGEQAPPTETPAAPAAPTSTQSAEAAAAGGIRFNFKGATFDQVLDFFSRQTGLPVVKETDVPEGTLDYLSPRDYDLPEALRVLNIILQSKGVMLRVSEDNLYLQKLSEMQREDIPTFVGQIPAEVTSDQIVTVVQPLKIALAKNLAEKLATMVAAYGSVASIDAQNALVITETAAQVRRILGIIDELDREDPDGAVEIFPIKHAKAAELMVPLKALLSQKIEKYVINQQGQQVKIEDEQMPGLAISSDDRTNSIIAKGAQQRIDKLGETIELLDVPAAEGVGLGRSMRVISLAVLAASEAAAKLNELYQRVEEKSRPTVLALDNVSKIVIVGDDAAVSEGTRLISEMDGAAAMPDAQAAQPQVVSITLERAQPAPVIAAITSLLSKRQQAAVKLVPGPDGRSIIVSGLPGDVESVRALVPVLDRQAAGDRQVRMIRITAPQDDPQELVAEARKLFDQQLPQHDPQHEIAIELDPEARLVTLVGTAKAVDAFTATLRTLESNVIVDRESKQYELANVVPSELVAPLAALAQPMLAPQDGRQFIPPTFAPIDQLHALVVTATPEQLAVLDGLIASLDRAAGAVEAMPPLRILRLHAGDAANLANVITAQYAKRSPQERKAKPVTVAADPQTNALLISAHADLVPEIEVIVAELNQTEGADLEGREVRVFPLKLARAENVVPLVQQLLASEEVPIWLRYDALNRNRALPDTGPEVRIAADARLNAVIIYAPLALLDIAEQMVAQLDVGNEPPAPGAARSLRVLAIANADAKELAVNLEAVFSEADELRAGEAKPVIRVDTASNSLLVRATDAQFAMIEAAVKQVDRATIASSQQMRTIPIDPAKGSAEEIARALQQMLDRSGAGGAGGVKVMTLEELLKPKPAPAPQPAAGSSSRSGDFGFWILDFGLESAPVPRLAGAMGASPAGGRIAGESCGDENHPRSSAQSISHDSPASDGYGGLRACCAGESWHRPDEQAPIQNPKSKIQNPILAALAFTVIAMQDVAQGEPPAEPAVTIAVDPLTNSLIFLGSPRAVERLVNLVRQIQEQIPAAPGTIRAITLPANLDSEHLADIINQTLEKVAPRGGAPGEMKKRVAVIGDPAGGGGGTLIISANDADFAVIADLIAALAKPAGGVKEFPIRTITLQRAQAMQVAAAIQQFYNDRARLAGAAGRTTAAGGAAANRRVAIMGVESSNTLLISSSDEDFAQIEQLVQQFDTAEAAAGLSFRVFQLKHARAGDIERAVQDLVNDLLWNQPDTMIYYWPPRSTSSSRKDTIAVRADERLNSLIVTGRGDKFEVVEQMIEILDAPPPQGGTKVVQLYRVLHAQPSIIADVIRETFNAGRQRRPWEPPDPSAVNVRIDDASRLLIVSALEKEQADIAQMIEALEAQVAAARGGAGAIAHETEVLPVKFARASELAETLTRFLADRARATNAARPTAAIIPSDSANTLIISASGAELATVRELVAQLDQQDVTGERVIEIIALQQGDAAEIARILKEQFGRRAGGAATGGGAGVTVTADPRTNSLIINAPREEFAQAEALIARLDAPSASDETIIRTYTLKGAQAAEAVRILTQTLQLDARGQTPRDAIGQGISIKLENSDAPAVEVNARVVADRRSNSLIVTATEQSFPVIESLIAKLDDVPATSPIEWRIINLKHALAPDVSFTLNQVTRGLETPGEGGQPRPRIDYNRLENQLIIGATADQFKAIDNILTQIDVPSQKQRITDFVPVKFAEAEKIQEALSVFYGPFAMEADTPGKQNVRIVADPATNSLVISAEEAEWEGIRALLAKLDSEEYDDSLQLRVIPLRHADAQSVAQAINDAFQGQLTGDQRAPGGRNAGGRGVSPGRGAATGETPGPPREGVIPTVLVQNEEWVRASAEPQTNTVIVSASRPNIEKVEQIIAQLDIADYAKLPPPKIIPITAGDPVQFAATLTELYQQSRGGRGGAAGARDLRIVGNVSSNTIIVRAEADDFEQIALLAATLQEHAATSGLLVSVMQVRSAPAARIASAITEAFAAKAKQANQSLAIKVDAPGNNLIVAAPGPLTEEIRKTVEQLDALAPAAGQGIFIIDLQNLAPENAKSIIETIGLDKPAPPDSTSRLVTEPIKVGLVPGRGAIMVVANPVDRETIVNLLRALDAEPPLAEAQLKLVLLKHAEATALAQVLQEVLTPAQQQAQTPLARAVQEQIRRLNIRRDRPDDGALLLDLSKPIRIIAQPALNGLIISSTYENLAVLEQLIALFDQLPITDAVTVQLFPLQNIAVADFARIVKDLFTQGKQLGKRRMTNVQGVPEGAVGKAILDEVAMTVDERTNTIVVAGTEDAVALVEVLAKRIDADVTAAWVEPRIVPLQHADAQDMAETLNAILVEGAGNLPQSSPLQKQVGRLRMARLNQNGGQVLESDVFAPMTRLIIRPEETLNALVLIGTPANLEVVSELVAMLDVEGASRSDTVRIYPVENASAAALAQTIRQLFNQQVQSRAIRPEDRVIVQADERTNSLIIATTPRSFAMVEHLLATLDSTLPPDLRELRQIEIKNASATRLASMIHQLMDARLERLRRLQPETADLERVTVIADPRTNSLVVAAGRDSFEVVRRLVADLDRTTLGDAALVHVLPLDKGNVDRVAQTINQIMQRRYAEMPAEVRASQRPLILTDPVSNSLLIAANPEDLASIEDLIAKLGEAPLNPAVGIELVQLPPGVRAEFIAPRVQRLMQDRASTLGPAATPTDRVTIEPDLASNSLIVAASDENQRVVRELVDMLVQAERDANAGAVDGEGTGLPREIEFVPLRSSRADDIVDMLNDLYVEEANRTRGENTVRVIPDHRLNAVLINAPAADVRALKNLIAQLDGARPASVVEIKYVPLKSANALETVSLIENVLSGRGLTARRGTPQATVLKYLRQIQRQVEPGTEPLPEPIPPVEGQEDEPVEMEVSTAIRESINLTPDLRTNTIIVSAPRESMKLIEQMIRDLDESNTGSKSIRIFKLVNADALAMAEILTDLFNLRQGSSFFVLKPREDAAPPAAFDQTGGAVAPLIAADTLGGVSGTELTAVPDERQQLSITVDSRTNSLIVSGTPRYLDLVSQVVDELDALEATEREIFVYQLRNAVAADVARVVGEFVEQEQQKLIATLSPDQLGSAARLLEREITIQGDDNSNTVLVSASPRYMDRVKEMIEKLDVDPPQVLIQVMLAEVTLDSTDEWGVDMSISGEVGRATVSGGFGLASAFVTGMGVPNLAIASSDFNLLIRALRSQGRLQVLSNPSVMAANNSPARIQVGETVRLPALTSISDTGQTSTTLEKEELGVILEVTPSINPDGFVRMTINPEISNLSARTTQVSEDFQSPIITRRNADTTVTVHDGQTIVIGGLISDRFERRDRKVPFFGDLPIFGPLFRSNREETAKTELLIVLTPHVIDSPTSFERVDEISAAEIDRLSLPDDVKEQIRRSILEGTGGLYDAQGNPIKVREEDKK